MFRIININTKIILLLGNNPQNKDKNKILFNLYKLMKNNKIIKVYYYQFLIPNSMKYNKHKMIIANKM